jgi:uncharacterized OB-fold protein
MQPRSSSGRPLPLVTPLSQPYFDAARENRLLLQQCPRDGFFFYPREFCPHCLQDDWQWQEARKLGEVYSYTVEQTGQEPGLKGMTPFAIAVVDLLDGPRVIGNVRGEDLEGLAVGAKVVLFFEQVEQASILFFRPA